MASLRAVYRAEVVSAKGRRVGRVREVLFDVSRPVVVGFIVERPRLFMLFDRKDRHLALDRSQVSGDRVSVTEEAGAWDRAAEKRLGFVWDDTVVWSGMPVRTEKGTAVGAVRDALFDTRTGTLQALGLTGGVATDLTVGVRDIEAENVKGFSDGYVVVDGAALETKLSGGAAAAAGRGAAVAKAQASDAAKVAGAAAKTAVAYGRSAAKVAANSETGKKAMGWLRAMRDELADAMGDPEDEKK